MTARDETLLHVEPELTSPVLLCDADGRLLRESVGWSRHALHTCNLPDTLARKKRWNYWCVTDASVLFSATIADIDFVSLAFVYIYDLETHAFAEKTVVLAPGATPLPQTVAGDITFAHEAMTVALTDDDGGGTRIRVDCTDFRGVPLRADLRIARPAGHETLNVVIPWSDDQFQFTSKQNCLPASGSIAYGDRTYALTAPAFGCLDYGRGVWPEETAWNWGAASGVQGAQTVGLNLGGGWTDGTGMTENAICVDGRIAKISEDSSFEYDARDLMTPWRIRTVGSERIDLRFVPVYERVAKSDNAVYMSEVHQLFGHYTGTVTPDDGAAITLVAMFGWIEDHVARW